MVDGYVEQESLIDSCQEELDYYYYQLLLLTRKVEKASYSSKGDSFGTEGKNTLGCEERIMTIYAPLVNQKRQTLKLFHL
jgi:hypothetical protein